MRYSELTDPEIAALIENRWHSSATLWDTIKEVTKENIAVYEGKMTWFQKARIPPTRPKVSSNRVFTNQEAVINSLIANPPRPNMIPGRDGEEAKAVARMLEKALSIKYTKLNIKEIVRMALRDLYFSRLLVLKPFWNLKTNDVDVRRVDPNKVRFSNDARNELESEFAIEELDCTLLKLIERFPTKKAEIIKAANVPEERIYIDNPSCVYKEAWVGDEMFVKFNAEVLYKGRNPYWDWDGLLATREELATLEANDDEPLRAKLGRMRSATMPVTGADGVEGSEQSVQKLRAQEKVEGATYEAYLFNYFDTPRKPYIFATVFNNENKPIGRTSFIEQAKSLQELVDRAKYQTYLNMEMVNGITKVNSDSGVTKADAQTLRYDAGGVLWGKDAVNGVVREFGTGLPAFVFQDMQDSREEIDNIMAATSAFRGEREGQETKAGRLALIEQSFLRLNEMVQVVDYVMQELFSWWVQLMKVNYTERHLVKDFGADESLEIIELMQDDIENGVEVRVIAGKSLPEDRRFMFERAQSDVKDGYISPLDYLTDAGYQNPKEMARNAYEFAQNPAKVLGVEQPQSEQPQPPVEQPQQLPVGALPGTL